MTSQPTDHEFAAALGIAPDRLLRTPAGDPRHEDKDSGGVWVLSSDSTVHLYVTCDIHTVGFASDVINDVGATVRALAAAREAFIASFGVAVTP